MLSFQQMGFATFKMFQIKFRFYVQ